MIDHENRTCTPSVTPASGRGRPDCRWTTSCARRTRLGFDAVMLMAKRPHLSVLDYDAAARHRLRDRLTELDLHVACLAGYTDFCMGADRPDIPSREMQVLYVRELCRLAHDLGCGLVRIFTGFEQVSASFEQQWTAASTSLQECARLAAPLGVTIGVQNHHDVAGHWRELARPAGGHERTELQGDVRRLGAGPARRRPGGRRQAGRSLHGPHHGRRLRAPAALPLPAAAGQL